MVIFGVIWAATVAAAAVGVEEEGRFNFGRTADYPRPQPRAKKKLPNRHSRVKRDIVAKADLVVDNKAAKRQNLGPRKSENEMNAGWKQSIKLPTPKILNIHPVVNTIVFFVHKCHSLSIEPVRPIKGMTV